MPRIAHAVLDSEKGYVASIQVRRHTLIADEPPSRGGTDAGPVPYELLLSALAACTAITLRMAAEHKGWQLGTIRIDLELHKENETGADRITRAISFTGALSAEQKASLARVAEKTPVTRTIKAGAPIETTFL